VINFSNYFQAFDAEPGPSHDTNNEANEEEGFSYIKVSKCLMLQTLNLFANVHWIDPFEEHCNDKI